MKYVNLLRGTKRNMQISHIWFFPSFKGIVFLSYTKNNWGETKLFKDVISIITS